MPGDPSRVLVLTHPYYFFDTDGRMEDELTRAVESFDGDIAGIGTSRGKRHKGEPYGGREVYDLWYEDVNGYGRLERDDAREVSSYDYQLLGGLGEMQCVGRSKNSIERAGGEPEVRKDLVDDTDIFDHWPF